MYRRFGNKGCSFCDSELLREAKPLVGEVGCETVVGNIPLSLFTRMAESVKSLEKDFSFFGGNIVDANAVTIRKSFKDLKQDEVTIKWMVLC